MVAWRGESLANHLASNYASCWYAILSLPSKTTMSTEKKASFTCGNFLVTITLLQTLEVAEELVGLVYAGLTQLLQRKPASKWEKQAAGYEKRPSGFERNTIPFSEGQAEEMACIMQEAVKAWATVKVTEYVPEVKLGKFKEEIDLIARHESENDVETWLAEKVGFEGDHTDDTTESGYSLEALQAVNAYKRAAMKGL